MAEGYLPPGLYEGLLLRKQIPNLDTVIPIEAAAALAGPFVTRRKSDLRQRMHAPGVVARVSQYL